MPGECIPKNKVFGRESESQQCTPDNRRRGLRKTMTALSRLARPSWLDPKANLLRFKTSDFVSSKQNPFGRHGDASKMPTPVTERFAYNRQPRFFQSSDKVSAQLLPSNARHARADVVFLINLPPRIEHSPGWRFFQEIEKAFNRFTRHDPG